MTAPRVSVVISTHNRAGVLPTALKALLTQGAAVRYEVIVVDNGCTDSSAEIVQAQLASCPHLRYIFEPRLGLPHGRNAGVRAARGAIIAFTDDDVEVPEGWVASIARVFDAHPDVDMIGGPVRPVWPAALPSWVTSRQLGPFALGERGDVPMRVGAHNAAPCLVGANMAFRRDVFDRIGLFDPVYTKSQDREIQLRLWRADRIGLYTPEIAISVAVPAERLTKKYFRSWYRTYGLYHSRMRLLDVIDRDGRLIEPSGRRLLGVPGFVYRAALRSTLSWVRAVVTLDGDTAFFYENRFRYLFNYIRERHREHGRPRAQALEAL